MILVDKDYLEGKSDIPNKLERAFIDYIDNSKVGLSWEEKGLIENAPESAKEAFRQYKNMKEAFRKEGIE